MHNSAKLKDKKIGILSHFPHLSFVIERVKDGQINLGIFMIMKFKAHTKYISLIFFRYIGILYSLQEVNSI